MSAEPHHDPAVPPHPPIRSAAALAHDACTALTVAHGRLQRLRRKIDRGEVDCAAFLVELDDGCLAIRRAVALIDALEDAGRVRDVLSGLGVPPAPRPTDD